MKDFEKIYNQETNEKTALILMLSVLSEKLTEITISIKELGEMSKEMLSCIKEGKEFITHGLLSPEDYVD